MVQPVDDERLDRAAVSASANRTIGLVVGGFAVGAILGFLTRPSVFIVRQLSLATVLTRGGNLSGLDRLLVPTAQQSFNQMLFGAILGAVAGFVVALFLNRRIGSQA